MGICKVSSASHFDKGMALSTSRKASSETYWIPNTDVYSTDTGIVIKVELAGIRREDLELTAEGNRLTISGSRPDCCRAANAKCKFLVMEINYGAFESIIELPHGYDLSQARAVYQNGFLRIDVPERAHPPKKHLPIPVTSAEE
jgi:HSP20 family protein